MADAKPDLDSFRSLQSEGVARVTLSVPVSTRDETLRVLDTYGELAETRPNPFCVGSWSHSDPQPTKLLGVQLVMPPRPTRPRASSISPMCRRPCW